MRDAGHTAVEIEPQLQPLNGEVFDYKTANKDDEARSDIKCCGYWSNMRQAYFDVKVVSPFARSNAKLEPAQLFKNAERSKIREYRERIRNVEHADFSPLVFTCAGGMAPQSYLVMKRLAEKLSKKQNIQLSVVSGWSMQAEFRAASYNPAVCSCNSTKESENNIELAVVTTRIDY